MSRSLIALGLAVAAAAAIGYVALSPREAAVENKAAPAPAPKPAAASAGPRIAPFRLGKVDLAVRPPPGGIASAGGYELATMLESCAQGDAGTVPAECKDVAPGLLAQRSAIRERAAAEGDVRAQVTYIDNPPPEIRTEDGAFKYPEKVIEFKAKALGYLHAAADAGAVQAFSRLSGVYRDGTLAPRDPVLALAYYLAATTADPQADPGRSALGWYQDGMTPEQVARAGEMQARILAPRAGSPPPL